MSLIEVIEFTGLYKIEACLPQLGIFFFLLETWGFLSLIDFNIGLTEVFFLLTQWYRGGKNILLSGTREKRKFSANNRKNLHLDTLTV